MEKRLEARRETDHEAHTPPCPILKDYIDIAEQIHIDLQLIKQTLNETKEMLEAFKNAKGFIKTVQIMGDLAKWAMAIVAATTAVYWWMKK